MKYSDIGHAKPDEAMVWIYNGQARRGGLDWHRGNRGTHESMYGPTYVKHWRGRMDLATRVVSVKAPDGEKDPFCPEWLRKALNDEFKTDDRELTIHNFGLGDWCIDPPKQAPA